MSQFQIKRQFHAVGQGLFCSETVESGKRILHTIVYDCGSLQKPVSCVPQIAAFAEYLGKNPKIDFLFISHFHSDHVSGIKKLYDMCGGAIKCVVVPKLTPDLIINVCSNVDNSSDDYQQDCIDTINFCLQLRGKGKLIEVPPFYFDAEENAGNDFDNSDFRRKFEKYKGEILELSSRLKFRAWPCHPFLQYIPFNLQDKRNEVLCKKLEKEQNQLYKQLVAGDPHLLKDKESARRLRNIYKAAGFANDLNESSMPVLSCATAALGKRANCLYTGDYTSTVDPECRLMQDFYREYWSDISILQVPHHGAAKSNPDELYKNLHDVDCVLCYGDNNYYKHPDAETISRISQYAHSEHRVTETTDDYIITEQKKFKTVFI